MNRWYAQLGLALLSSALWVVAAPPFDLWPLAWVAMVPAIWLWSRAPTAGRASLLGWVTGAGMTIGGFHWFVGLMQQHAKLPLPVAVLTLVALAAYQGLAMLIAARVVWRVRSWQRLPMALVAGAAVVALEHAWPVIFPYQVAVTQVAAPPVIQVADLFGGTFVSWMLIAASGAIVDLVERRWRPAAIVAGVVALSLVYGFVRIADVEDTRAAAPHLAVGLVQPNEDIQLGVVDPVGDRERLAQIHATSARLEAEGAELVVWSESSFPQPISRATVRDRGVLRRGFEVPVVVGAITAEDRRRYNSSILLVGDDLVARHDKVHRVLGSEWNPVVEWFPSLEGTLPPGFAGGDGPVILPLRIAGTDVRLGPMICLEDIVPRYGRALAAERPNLLVNQTIDTWFGTFAEPWQHRGLAVLRAVELRADMVRAVNTGPSGLVYATGRLGPQTPVRSGVAPVEGLVVEVALVEAGQTLYARIGELFAWVCLFATIVGWWMARRERKRASRAGGRAPAPAAAGRRGRSRST